MAKLRLLRSERHSDPVATETHSTTAHSATVDNAREMRHAAACARRVSADKPGRIWAGAVWSLSIVDIHSVSAICA